MSLRKYTNSTSRIGRASRKVTDAIGAKGVREAAYAYGANQKVNKKRLAVGLVNTALAATGGAGIARTIGRSATKFAAKRVAAAGVKKAAKRKTAKAIKKQDPYYGYQGRKQRMFEKETMRQRKNKKKK